MTKEESEKDPSELVCDLLECFMMTWEELMGTTSTTRYDIWSENVTKTLNYPTSTNGGKHFKPQASYQMPIYEGRHFEPQSNYLKSTYGGDTSNLKISIQMTQQKLPTSQEGETLQTPAFGDRQPNRILE